MLEMNFSNEGQGTVYFNQMDSDFEEVASLKSNGQLKLKRSWTHGLKKPPEALHPIISDNTCILCVTTAASTELADTFSSNIVIASSREKEVHNPNSIRYCSVRLSPNKGEPRSLGVSSIESIIS